MKTILILIIALMSFSTFAHADALKIATAKILHDVASDATVRAVISQQRHMGGHCSKPELVSKVGSAPNVQPNYDFETRITCVFPPAGEGDGDHDTFVNVKGIYYDPTEGMILQSLTFDYAD